MDENTDLYILDFTNVKYYSEFHTIIMESLDFPDYYGRNWDAFWDCITDMVGDPMHIQIVGFETVERRFGDTAETMLKILRRAKHYANDRYADITRIEIIRANYIETVE